MDYKIILFFLIPIIIMPTSFVLMFLYRKKFSRVLPFFTMSLGLFSAGIEPKFTDDLYYYYSLMDEMRIRGLDFVQTLSGYRDFPGANYYFYVISKIEFNNILPAITTFIIYSIILYILFDYANNNSIKTKPLLFSVIFVFSVIPFLEIAGGIVNALSFTIFALALYRDLIKKNKGILTILIYIASATFHSTAFVLIFIRLMLFFVKNNKTSLVIAIIVFLWPVYLDIIVNFFNILPTNVVTSIVTKKIIDYSSTAKGDLGWSREILIYRFSMIVLMLSLILAKTLNNKKKYLQSEYLNYVVLVAFFVLGSFNGMYVNIIFRFSSFIFMVSGIIIMHGVEGNNKFFKVMALYFLTIFILAGTYYHYLEISNLNFLY